MVKIQNGLAQRLLLLVAHAAVLGLPGMDGVTMSNFVRARRSDSPTWGRLWYYLANGHIPLEPGEFDIQALADELRAALETSDNGEAVDEAKLIDMVVNILLSGRSSSVLAGSTLGALRKSLLIPSELRGLEERLTRGDLACSRCGKDLHNGEMTVITGGPEVGPVRLLCCRCGTPQTIACSTPGCSGWSAIPKAVANWFRKTHLCADHTAAAAGSSAAALPTPEQILEDRPVTLRTRPLQIRPDTPQMRAWTAQQQGITTEAMRAALNQPQVIRWTPEEEEDPE